MTTDYFGSDLVESMIKMVYVDENPKQDYKEKLLNRLIFSYSARGEDMRKVSWKVALSFGLASLAVAGIIAYGLWLPTSLDFLSMF